MSKKHIAFACDDKDSFSGFYVKQLQNLDFRVTLCKSAQEVLQLFKAGERQKPDMLMTDGMLPHGDEFSKEETSGGFDTGVAIYRRLRKTGNHTLPIVIFTSELQTFDHLCVISDPHLTAISLYEENFAKKILDAARKLLLKAAPVPAQKRPNA